jgi:hypothetical protein
MSTPIATTTTATPISFHVSGRIRGDLYRSPIGPTQR